MHKTTLMNIVNNKTKAFFLLSNSCICFSVLLNGFFFFKKEQHNGNTKYPHIFPLVSLCIIFGLWHRLVSVCEFAWPVFSLPLYRRQAWNLSVLLKTYISSHRRGGLAAQLPELRGKRAGGEEGERWRQQRSRKEKKGERLFCAGSQQPDSDQSASRLVPLVQWSRTTGETAL